MRKLILGIVAVVCAQIMFQIFVSVDRSDADYGAKNSPGPLVETVSVAESPVINEFADNIEPTATNTRQPSSAKRPAPRNIEARRAVFHRPPPVNVRSASTVAIAPRLPETKPFAPQTETHAAYLVMKESRASKKRSLLSKTLPVIKKPYNWLKAVASKLK